MDPDASAPAEPAPAVFNYVLSFVLVGVAWGFTTPFIRRAAADFNARQEKLSRGPGATTDTPRTTSTTTGLEEEDEDEDDRAAASQLGGISAQSSARRERADSHIHNHHNEDSDEHNDEDNTPAPAWKRSSSSSPSWLRTKITTLFWTVINLLRTPAYSIPLVINLTGVFGFFCLLGNTVCISPCSREVKMKEKKRKRMLTPAICRALTHRPTGQLQRVPLHRSGGVVRRAEGYCPRDVVGTIFGAGWDCVVCSFEEFGGLI